MSDSRIASRIFCASSVLLMLLHFSVAYSQSLVPGRQTGVTTIDSEGRIFSISGAELQKPSSERPPNSLVSFQLTTAAPHKNAGNRLFDLRMIQIDLLAHGKLHTLFKEVCRLPKPDLGVPHNEIDSLVLKPQKAETFVTTINEKGKILTVPGSTISHSSEESETPDVTIQFTSIPLTAAQLDQQFELKSVNIQLMANGQHLSLFDGLFHARVPQGPEVQEQDPSPVGGDQIRANAELNRIVGTDRTVIKAPSTKTIQDFPTVSDNSLYYNLFRDPSLAREIDLIPEQKVEIDAKIKAVLDKLNPLRAKFETSQSAEEREDLRQRATALIADFDEDYRKIVTPQLNLINRRLVSMHLKRDGFFQLVINSGLYSQLGLTDSQRIKMSQLTSEMAEDFGKQFEQMHREALKKIEQGFTENQRQKILDLTGAKELSELLPSNLPQLYYQLLRAQQQFEQDEDLQKLKNQAHGN